MEPPRNSIATLAAGKHACSASACGSRHNCVHVQQKWWRIYGCTAGALKYASSKGHNLFEGNAVCVPAACKFTCVHPCCLQARLASMPVQSPRPGMMTHMHLCRQARRLSPPLRPLPLSKSTAAGVCIGILFFCVLYQRLLHQQLHRPGPSLVQSFKLPTPTAPPLPVSGACCLHLASCFSQLSVASCRLLPDSCCIQILNVCMAISFYLTPCL